MKKIKEIQKQKKVTQISKTEQPNWQEESLFTTVILC